MEQPLLDIRGLRTQFFTDDGLARAVDGVSYSLEEGKPSALLGNQAVGRVSQLCLFCALSQTPRQNC